MLSLTKNEVISQLSQYKDILKLVSDLQKEKSDLTTEEKRLTRNINQNNKGYDAFITEKKKVLDKLKSDLHQYKRDAIAKYAILGLLSLLPSLAAAIFIAIMAKTPLSGSNPIPFFTLLLATSSLIFIMLISMISVSIESSWKRTENIFNAFPVTYITIPSIHDNQALRIYAIIAVILNVLIFAFLITNASSSSGGLSIELIITLLIPLIVYAIGWVSILIIIRKSIHRYITQNTDEWEKAENDSRTLLNEANQSNEAALAEIQNKLSKITLELDNYIEHPKYIEAHQFLPDTDAWIGDLNKAENVGMIIYFLEKNYVTDYGEALRYLDTILHQEKMEEKQKELRSKMRDAEYSARRAESEAERARREAETARLDAQQARFDANAARIRAQQAEVNALIRR